VYGECRQTIERSDFSGEVLSDRELFAIIRGGHPLEETDVPINCGPNEP
jgi:hypothetical protein